MTARIAILLPDLRPGGAERLHLELAREWTRRGIGVDFVLRQARGELLAQLPPRARVVDLAAARVRATLRPLAIYLRHDPPDALLAAMWPLTCIAPLAARMAGWRGRVVVSEHSPLSIAYAPKGALHRIGMRASMRLGYPLAQARIGVSAGVADDMAMLSGLPRTRFEVIHNPAATGRFAGEASRPAQLDGAGGALILSVGTLKAVKRHDLLIEAFAALDRPDARLYILGEGPERGRLQGLIDRLGLGGRVFLPGFQPDPLPWYAHADLFVLSSDYEGFGNVLVEALEQGVPVVSTDCPVGPREILDGGKHGTLVPVGDARALASAMQDGLARDHDREALKRRARDFSVDKAAETYLDQLWPGWRERIA